MPYPWWVNLLILVPALNFYFWRQRRLRLAWQTLIFAALFAAGFGFVEAAVVLYLRAAIGLLPGYQGTLADVVRLSAGVYEGSQDLRQFPPSLLTVEVAREAATMVMLLSVAMLAAPRRRERWAMFLWCFAMWDVTYYAGLWATIRWPVTLSSPDVLFLIPEPWLAPVWFPILVSLLCLVAIAGSRTRQESSVVLEPEPERSRAVSFTS